MRFLKTRFFLVSPLFGFFLIFIACVWLPGCKSKADRFYDQGLAKFYQGEIREALKNYEQGIKLEPKNPELLYANGWAHLVLGNSDRALIFFAKGIKFNPNHYGGYKGMGNIFLSLGQFEKAEENLKRAFLLNRKNPSIYSNLGDLYRLQGRPDEAKKYYDQGLQYSGKHIDIQNGLITLEIESKRYDQAIELAQKSLKGKYQQILLKSQTHFLLTTAYLERGKLFQEQGKKTAYVDDLNQALEVINATPEFNWKDLNIINLKTEIQTLLKNEKT